MLPARTIQKKAGNLDSASAPTTNPKKPQLTVIPLMTLYQRDGPCKGETEENILGSRKEEED